MKSRYKDGPRYNTLNKGDIVGNWTLISECYYDSGSWWFDCKCICGKVRSVRTWPLNHTGTKGCGCKRGSFKGVGDLSKSYYTAFKLARAGKGIKFSSKITMKYLWELFLKQEKKCAISGLPISLSRIWSIENTSKIKRTQTASIDRIDNSLGYTLNNIQWVHKDINFMKGGMDETTFICFCKAVAKYRVKCSCDNEDFTGKRKYFGKDL